MKRTVISGVILTLLLSILTLVFNIVSVEAQGPIYIRSDGSIEPSTAPIQHIGDVYTFTANIYDSIIVERDNIVVDGAGYTVQKTGSDTGITLQGRINVTIRNAVIRGFGFGFGIGLYFSNRCTLYGNRIEGNSSGPGISLSDSEYNKVLNNTLLNNGHSIMLTQSSNNVIDGNNASYNFHGIGMGDFCNN
ncbi:MAG: right-handed parallel beta-helix repeat-containing protein, partial [Candidatus Bathyarchaeota archaeon]|nr:right-handed parallel beta-helix repeat-containing protein [Candidatus Bathyarchaeota archaeon]MDH5745476.1 right-handed parallel beta-helix repeat-containing protein [Candidatus Bathyarchaeota archaeon]